MKAINVRTAEAAWTPASQTMGSRTVYEGKETVRMKILSDRRAEGGGLAYMLNVLPPPGKIVRIIAVAQSDENVYLLQGGHCNKAGEQIHFPGDYTLNPKGHPHSAYFAAETTSLVICTGEPDELRELGVIDPIQPGEASAVE